MKRPKKPVEPKKPYKPTEPSKQMSQNNLINYIEVENYSTFTLEEFSNNILCKNIKDLNLDVSKIHFRLEGCSTGTYYNESVNTVCISIYTSVMVDDPFYDKKYKNYCKQFAAYEKNIEIYNDALKEFDRKNGQYQIDYDKWMLETKKQEIKKLENKLKELKK